MQTLLKGGTLITEDGLRRGDLLIDGETIARIAERIDVGECDANCHVVEASGKFIMPGVIDAHTHYQLYSRNTVTADDFLSGSIAAAQGGVTTFIDYADHLRDRPLRACVEARMAQAAGQTVIDYTLHQTVTYFDDTISRELGELRDAGVNSIKIFTTYRREGLMIPMSVWEDLFHRLKEEELLLTVHAEDDAMVLAGEELYQKQGLVGPQYHSLMRSAASEASAVENVGLLAQKARMPIYIAHLSSEAGLSALQRVKASGGAIFAETTPHYLLLDDSLLQAPEAQKFIMTPPLRKQVDQKALWEGLSGGDIQIVATDHCSFTVEQKLSSDSCLTILPGLPGSETLLPLLHHFGVNGGQLDYPDLVRILSTAPAQIFGLYPRKGSLLPGSDADLVVFDPEKEVILHGNHLHSRAGYTPYEGFTVKGYPLMTYLRGRAIVIDGVFCGEPGEGRFVKGGCSSLYRDQG